MEHSHLRSATHALCAQKSTTALVLEDLKMSLKLPRFVKSFSPSFSPKKIPRRKSASLSSLHTLDRSTQEVELGLDYGPPSMNIGGHSLKFEDGQWITESGGNVAVREVERLKKKNMQLEEENNILKLKIEILIDMLTESTVEYHLMEKEVEVIKSQH
ncbi:protein chibby homolog 1 [Phycodurus eques]|uniref:protein chibby homolog 1 n=1 Tax=Phycodurus eques TaxID=693459 RepID=UPI002ACDE9D7|nr:protein chibby homolog 1 [Phycodurus eques]